MRVVCSSNGMYCNASRVGIFSYTKIVPMFGRGA